MSKAQTITANIMKDTSIQKTLFRVLISGITVLSLVYVYLIGSITFNVLARKALATTSRNLGAQVSELELTYLNITNKIDKSYALSLGFVDSHTSIFATRNTPSSVAIR